CQPFPPAGSPKCPLGSTTLPPPDEVDAQVQAYNAAIARVAQRNGAKVVDLYAAGQVPDQHPEYVSGDGFHPSTAGAAANAEKFRLALGGSVSGSCAAGSYRSCATLTTLRTESGPKPRAGRRPGRSHLRAVRGPAGFRPGPGRCPRRSRHP